MRECKLYQILEFETNSTTRTIVVDLVTPGTLRVSVTELVPEHSPRLGRYPPASLPNSSSTAISTPWLKDDFNQVAVDALPRRCVCGCARDDS